MPGVRSATYLCASIYIDTYIHLLHFMEKKITNFYGSLKQKLFICFVGFFLLIDASVAS